MNLSTSINSLPGRRLALPQAVCAVALAMAGCAGAPVGPVEVPAAIRAGIGQTMFLEALASGVQVYECAAKADAPSGYGWVFRAPEAALTDRAGKAIGKHYAGPTWQSVDGSTVTGTVTASDPGPQPAAIPWLLLTVKGTTGEGVLTQTKSIQRVRTQGGVMPSQPCGAEQAKQTVRVPYSATYYFYRPAL